MEDTDTSAVETTPLPETFAGDQDLASFETVEELAAGYKETAKKAASIGSLEVIPEDIRNDPNIKKYKDIGELAKGHLETVKLVGRKGVILPTENSTPEEKEKFYNSIGRPEKAELYKFTPIENLHHTIQIQPESEAAFKGIAHQLGLTQSQADGLNAWYLSNVSGQLGKQDEAFDIAKKGAETKLRAEWGAEYNQNLILAKRITEKFGGKEAIAALGDLGNNPAALKLLANIGKRMSEDSINHGEISDLATSTLDAKKRIEILNRQIMGMKTNDPDYDKLLKERIKLYEIAYPAGGEE